MCPAFGTSPMTVGATRRMLQANVHIEGQEMFTVMEQGHIGERCRVKDRTPIGYVYETLMSPLSLAPLTCSSKRLCEKWMIDFACEAHLSVNKGNLSRFRDITESFTFETIELFLH